MVFLQSEFIVAWRREKCKKPDASGSATDGPACRVELSLGEKETAFETTSTLPICHPERSATKSKDLSGDRRCFG
ncbi:MAG: hypothetical protein M3O82_00905, partial [Verrucomicrobiota bacterium]|nr:hypothetical protein [Verrucomicrobiota bacterium]